MKKNGFAGAASARKEWGGQSMLISVPASPCALQPRTCHTRGFRYYKPPIGSRRPSLLIAGFQGSPALLISVKLRSSHVLFLFLCDLLISKEINFRRYVLVLRSNG